MGRCAKRERPGVRAPGRSVKEGDLIMKRLGTARAQGSNSLELRALLVPGNVDCHRCCDGTCCAGGRSQTNCLTTTLRVWLAGHPGLIAWSAPCGWSLAPSVWSGDGVLCYELMPGGGLVPRIYVRSWFVVRVKSSILGVLKMTSSLAFAGALPLIHHLGW
jgi:hypothetical protein